EANDSAAFPARAYHSSVVTSGGTMWVIGGYDGSTKNLYNDVWNSTDGANWAQATASAGWAVRYGHSSVVFDSKIWVIGGEIPGKEGNKKNDVWYSADGATWTEANDSAAFSARYGHTSVVTPDGKMWVIGGNNGSSDLNDAWYSTDGANWAEANDSAAFPARAYHSSVVSSDGRIWVIGGYDGYTPDTFNDVWYSSDGVNWVFVNISSWNARNQHSSAYANGYIWVLGGRSGTSGTPHNDSWATPIPPWYRDMDGSGTEWGKNFTASHGNNNVKVRCWDIAGNLNSSKQWFNVDVRGPVITISSPLNQSYTTSSTTLTVSLDETATTCQYSLNGAANVTMTGSGTSWSSSATAANRGNTITVSCQDELGNWNSESVAFTASFAVCGNQICETGETSSSCPADCPAAAAATGGGGVPAKEQVNFYNLKANVPAEKMLDEEGIALTKIKVIPTQDTNNVKISIEKKESIPDEAKEPEGKVYQVLDIKLETEVEIKVEICFSVEKEWLEGQKAQKEDVALAHYKPRIVYNLRPVSINSNEMRLSFRAEQEDWEYLPTEIVKIEPEKTEYCSETKEFSTYAIVARKPEIKEFIDVIQPTIEEQIIEPRKEPVLRRKIDLWGWRIPITAMVDIFLVISLVSLVLYGRRLEYFMPEIEEALPAPQPQKAAKPEKALVEFAKLNILQGMEEGSILEKMALQNIEKETGCAAVKKAYDNICRMSGHELMPHVTESVMRGYPDEQIKATFMKNGVSAKCVSSAIKAARGRISKASSQVVGPFVLRCIYSGIEDNKIKEMLVKHGIREKKALALIKKVHSEAKKRHLNH
ncbi:MAG: kelch repeat-containing protein, partial [Nanoarchaeota archaeon]|nr:kelch repeat-containing protein [Nanoarchaeota archaeon]